MPQVASMKTQDALPKLTTLRKKNSVGSDKILLRTHKIGDIGWVARRQGMLYAQEYGWDGTFEALVAEIGARFILKFKPEHERCWIAERDGEILGSVFLVKKSKYVAQLRMLYVEPEARGTGLGRRLTRECIQFARDKGYKKITLWTNDILVAARAIYVSEGFKLVAQEKHHSFGHDMIGQHWDLKLPHSPSNLDADQTKNPLPSRSPP
jgi:GNAT superfamily N-acetyltransferase